MTADTLEDAADEFTAAASSAADKGQKALNEAIEKAQAKVAETARVAQKALKEHATRRRFTARRPASSSTTHSATSSTRSMNGPWPPF